MNLPDLRSNIQKGAVLDFDFIAMNALAGVIGSYGLLMDSSAVIIGAMVIATLLGPISGIALALVDNNTQLLLKSFVAEFCGTVVVLLISFVIGRIHYELPLTHEIRLRTTPGIPDLFVALAGGGAATLAELSPRISTSIVGVAIATALVPPLAASGICFARHELKLAIGALLLFATNLVAIQFASSVLMWFHGLHQITETKEHRGLAIMANTLSLAMTFLIGSVVAFHFSKSISKMNFENDVRKYLTKALSDYPAARLSDILF